MLNKPGGFYKFPLYVGWNVPDTVDFISFTVNGLTPTLSEYIAYDTLTPPNPFIAVTQDGLGRVVYDGGFPKLYNLYVPSGAPSSTFRYMINAVNWCSKEGVPKRILALGTGKVSDAYPLKGTTQTGFATSLRYIAQQAGAEIVFKDVTDFTSGKIDVTKNELATYSLVFFLDSTHNSIVQITDQAVQNILEFREAGGGLILVTDHGTALTNVDVAYSSTYSGFFRTVNRIAANLSAYFSGNYDRTPVNVGFIRQTYGDHLLYTGLSNEDSIAAGGSESAVVVTSYPKYKPNELPTIPMETGSYHVQILVRYYDGSIKIIRDNFTIDNAVPVEYRKLLVRENTAAPFISNFTKGGWKIGYNGEFIQMSPSNTKMWDAEKEAWVSVK